MGSKLGHSCAEAVARVIYQAVQAGIFATARVDWLGHSLAVQWG